MDFGMDLDDLLEGLRSGRFTEKTAAQWLENNIQAARQARRPGLALPGDEFAPLFPPTAPLGEDSEEYPPAPRVYEPPGRGNRQGFATPNFPRYVPYASAHHPPARQFSALSPAVEMDDEEAAELWPPRTEQEAERRAAAARAQRPQDEPDEMAHWLLFGDESKWDSE